MTRPEIKRIDATAFNKWQSERHYLKRQIIRSKLLAHGIFVSGQLVGGLLWATPHFTKKLGLFGYDGLLDKWEVLMLARFWLADNCGLIASQVMMESIGNGHGRGSKRLGWRLQEDWVKENPPPFPDSPFVPRLLISWSDTKWGHKGTIYKASGWKYWDETNVNYYRTGRGDRELWRDDANNGQKTCWIMRLGPNPRAIRMGQVPIQTSLFGDFDNTMAAPGMATVDGRGA